MRKLAVLGSLSLGVLALALSAQGSGIDAKIAEQVKKIAEAVEKGDDAAAQKQAAAVAKQIDTLDEVMHGFKLRTKKGIGVGSTAGVSQPDGIDLRLVGLARDGITPAALAKEGK